MNNVNRLLINICSDKLSESKSFYTQLFDFKVAYNSDWFVHLLSKDKQLELGIISRNSQLVPKEYQKHPQGFYITFVVDDADAIYEEAKRNDFKIIEPPKDTKYGQRRILLKDPDGTLVDVSSPIQYFNF